MIVFCFYLITLFDYRAALTLIITNLQYLLINMEDVAGSIDDTM